MQGDAAKMGGDAGEMQGDAAKMQGDAAKMEGRCREMQQRCREKQGRWEALTSWQVEEGFGHLAGCMLLRCLATECVLSIARAYI